MHLAGLWLTDFRCYEEATLRFPPGVTVICGANAQGKTSLLEAVGWAATGKSFRVPLCAIFFFDGEQIVNERIYFDTASLVTQIGRGELLALAGTLGD